VGRSAGFEHFGTDAHAYLASLAPLVAFALVWGGIVAVASTPLVGIKVFLVILIYTIAPVVIAHPLCRRWQRDALWAMYANIVNWSKLLIVMLAPMAFGLSEAAPPVAGAVFLGFLGYSFWFQWFTARGALRISGWRALLLVIVTQAGSNLLVFLPLLTDPDERAKLLGN